jgi:hypothetical protein
MPNAGQGRGDARYGETDARPQQALSSPEYARVVAVSRNRMLLLPYKRAAGIVQICRDLRDDRFTAACYGLPMKMHCVECGSSVKASCRCGASYVPASQYAAEAVKRHPEKSDRAIAAEIGVSKDTVRRARATGANAPVESAKRTGQNGKARRLPQVEIARAEATRARAHAMAVMFGGESIPSASRALLIAVLQALHSGHPVERQRALLGLTWDQLIVPAELACAA